MCFKESTSEIISCFLNICSENRNNHFPSKEGKHKLSIKKREGIILYKRSGPGVRTLVSTGIKREKSKRSEQALLSEMGSICVGGDLKYATQHGNLVNSVEFNYCSTCSICRKKGVGAIGIGRPLSCFPFFINLNFYLFRGVHTFLIINC